MKKLSFTLLFAAFLCLAACGNNQNKKAEAVIEEQEIEACCAGEAKSCCGDECDGTCGESCEEGCEHHGNE